MKTVITCCAVAFLCVFAALDYYSRSVSLNEALQGRDVMGATARRYAKAAESIPEDAIVGYIPDADAGDTTDSPLFLGAQFALAPRILVSWDKAPDADYILADLRPGDYLEATIAELTEENGFMIEWQEPSGVVLYRPGDAR